MVRMQIQLTDEQAETVRRIARARGVSISAVIREAVDAGVVAPHAELRREQWERALAVLGAFHGGGGNVSVEHDAYLADAYADRR